MLYFVNNKRPNSTIWKSIRKITRNAKGWQKVITFCDSFASLRILSVKLRYAHAVNFEYNEYYILFLPQLAN